MATTSSPEITPNHGIEALGQDVLRQEERHQPQREDADRVGDRDGQAEGDGVAGRAARADQVGGDDGLAVAGRERVRGAEAEGDQQRQQHHWRCQVVGGDQHGERAATSLDRGAGAGQSPAAPAAGRR